MSVLATRLAALSKQAGVGMPLAQAREHPQSDLQRLLGFRLRSQARPLDHDRDLPGIELAPGVLYIERYYPWDAISPRINAMFADVVPGRTARPGKRPRPIFGWIPRQDLLLFDTETTGLSGGTGTRAFMIGAADWPDHRLRVRQIYLSAMSGESAMLSVFSQWLQSDTVLVSYNGRSYDAPLLATRYRLARMANPLAELRHLDLLYPVRRRFRGIWENCRLATIERQWLGVLREDDLPGSEAPRAWRDYLRGASARDLRRVIAHNDQDLRSLGGLLLRMGQTGECFA